MGKGEIDGSFSVDMRTGETSTEHTGRPWRHRGARAVALSVGVADEKRGEALAGKGTRAGGGNTREKEKVLRSGGEPPFRLPKERPSLFTSPNYR